MGNNKASQIVRSMIKDGTTDEIAAVIDNALAVTASAADGGTTGLTFSTVVISEAAAGVADLGVGAAGEAVRLHELVLTMVGQGTVTVNSDDDGAGTNPVDLTGDIPLGAGGGINRAFSSDHRGSLATPAAKHMTITFATAGGSGWAVISKGTA